MRTRKIFPSPTNGFKNIEVLLNLHFKVHDLTNSGIHHQFLIYYKGGKVSQLRVSSCGAQIQWVACASSKKSAF